MRYNIYRNVHKGLRGMLFMLQIRLQQTDFSEDSALFVIDDLEKALSYLEGHGINQGQFIMSHLAKHEDHIMCEISKDHLIEIRLSEELRSHVSSWKLALLPQGMLEAGERICRTMNEYIAFNLYHMNREEGEVLLLLWKHFTDEQIIAMERELLNALDSCVLMDISRWMMRHLSTAEIRSWLMGMMESAPKEMYTAFTAMAREELPDLRYFALGLKEPVQTTA